MCDPLVVNVQHVEELPKCSAAVPCAITCTTGRGCSCRTPIFGSNTNRRHLPKGLHLIFSDQTHRRTDRTAGLWLQASDDEQVVGPYHDAPAIPEANAAKQRRATFRLPDEAALRRYVENDRG